MTTLPKCYLEITADEKGYEDDPPDKRPPTKSLGKIVVQVYIYRAIPCMSMISQLRFLSFEV